MEDIVPSLLEKIQADFNVKTLVSDKLKVALKMLNDKKADYLTVNDFAVEVGKILSSVFADHITASALPDSRMYYNIAERILNPTMSNNYSLITDFSADVQALLNANAGISIRAQVPELNQSRIDGMIERLADARDFDEIKWILDDPIINFCQSVVDDAIKANADFHYNAGLKPVITRRLGGDACAWCRSLAGSYDYHSEPDDIYRRHERCRCTVEYRPDKKRRQNVWDKKWQDNERESEIEARKQIGIRTPRLSGAERAALIKYIGPDAYVLNDTLRRGLGLTAEQSKWVDDLNSALNKLPKYQGKVMRSLSFHNQDDLLAFIRRHEMGEVIEYNSFTSASKKVYNEDDNIRVFIHSKNGSDLKDFNDNEGEVLYGTNKRFKVIDRYVLNGKPIIELEEYYD